MINNELNHYVDSSVHSSTGIFILEASLGSFDGYPQGDVLEKLMLCLEATAIQNPLSHVRESACRLIAAIINKLPEGNFSL